MILSEIFYKMSAIDASPALCGKILAVKGADGIIRRCRITETECYSGEEDTACHAHRGRTKRTETMYLPGGYAYVYLCYGIHSLLNIVTGERDHPEAVLIRCADGYDGPGKLTRAMGITTAHNGLSLVDSGIIFCEDDGFVPEIEALPRVGIGYADECDRNRLWRFRTVK